MNLDEVRRDIDAIDNQIRDLILKRMDCSYRVAQSKHEANSTDVYRPEREKAMLDRLTQGVPEDRIPGYSSVVRKITETSRMYQYGLLFEWNNSVLELVDGHQHIKYSTRVRVRATRPNKPNAGSSLLSMIGDYGYDMDSMDVFEFSPDEATFDLVIIGNAADIHMQKLLFQLSKECIDFSILSCD